MRLEVHLRSAERVGPAPQRRQVRGARHSRRIRRRHPVVQGRTGHSRHAGGRCPEEPYGKLPGPGEPERVRFRDFDLRGAPGTRQLDHDDQASIPVGAKDEPPGLAYNRLLRELRHSDPPPHSDASAAARRNGPNRSVLLATRSQIARTAANPAPPGPARCSASGSHAGYVPATASDNAWMTRPARSLRSRLAASTPSARIAGPPHQWIRRSLAPQPGTVGPAHQRLAKQRLDLRTAREGVATRVGRHEAGSYPNPRARAGRPPARSGARPSA